MSNSGLVSYTGLSPNHSGQRVHKIDRITPHCVVGQLSAESICSCFLSPSKRASCNYGIGKDGRISLCVDEKNRSWCSSSYANDQRAVTIECASDDKPPYTMNDVVYQSLINLCVDICKRNGKNRLLWLGNKEKTLAYQPKEGEMVLTVHRWFANKSCPGDWLYAKLGDLAGKVTKILGGSSSNPSTSEAEHIIQTPVLKVGDKVKLAGGAPIYGKSIRFQPWVYSCSLYVREISGNRVVISTQKSGAVTGAVDKKYLTKV
nr:N-acetylmuramoyl-L-alanine amidase [uncultured Agathobaculum sp.]